MLTCSPIGPSLKEENMRNDIFFEKKLNSFNFRWHLLVIDILLHRRVIMVVDENIVRMLVLMIDLDVIIVMMYEQSLRKKSIVEHFFLRRKNDFVEVVLDRINVDVRRVDIQLSNRHHHHPIKNNENPIVRVN